MGLACAAFLFVLLLALAPQERIPMRLAPVAAAKGAFAGEAVAVAAPTSKDGDVAATIRIRMDSGVCRVWHEREGERTELFQMGAGGMRSQIPSGSVLILDPQAHAGDYEVVIGPAWHPLGPKARRWVFLPMALAMLTTAVFIKPIRAQADRLGGRRLAYLTAVAVLSGLVLYPACHEGGHMLFGMLYGAEPNWGGVVWTCLAGAEPHASFRHLPSGAAPFMTAGGTIAPTLIALLLLLAWRGVRHKAAWPVSAGVLTVSILFLLATLGCLFELYKNTHMDALSVHFGLTGPLRIACSVSPTLVAAAAFVWLGAHARKAWSATASGAKTNENGVAPSRSE